MKMLSPSKIHRLINSPIPFKEWLDNTKNMYDYLISTGNASKYVDFETWLNLQYANQNISADGALIGNISDIIKGGAEQVLTEKQRQTVVETESQSENKTILGLPAITAYVIGGLLTLTATFVIVKYIRYKKQ